MAQVIFMLRQQHKILLSAGRKCLFLTARPAYNTEYDAGQYSLSNDCFNGEPALARTKYQQSEWRYYERADEQKPHCRTHKSWYLFLARSLCIEHFNKTVCKAYFRYIYFVGLRPAHNRDVYL